MKLFSEVSVPIKLGHVDRVQVRSVPEVGGLPGPGALEQDRGQAIEAVAGREVQQRRELAQV